MNLAQVQNTTGVDLIVYLLGYESLHSSNIKCSNNDTCTIYCNTYQNCQTANESSTCDENNACTIRIQILNASVADVYQNSTYIRVYNTTASISGTANPENEQRFDNLIAQCNMLGQYVAWGTLASCVVVVLGNYIYYTRVIKYKYDKPVFSNICRFLYNAGDFWTDILFVFLLYFENYLILFYIASLSMILTFFMSCIVAIYVIIKWQNKTQDNAKIRLKSYLANYKPFIFMLTILNGQFYSVIDLLKSKMMYQKLFFMPLKKKECNQLNKLRLINILILENIPQFFCQIMYLTLNATNASLLVYITMVFSILGILFTIMIKIPMIYEWCQQCLHSDKHFTHKTTISGKFSIISDELHSQHAFCYYRMTLCLKAVLEHSSVEQARRVVSSSFNLSRMATPELVDRHNRSHDGYRSEFGSPVSVADSNSVGSSMASAHKNWWSRDDISLDLEVYYIDSSHISVLNKMAVFFQLKILHFEDFGINQAIFKSIENCGIQGTTESSMFFKVEYITHMHLIAHQFFL